MDSGFKSRKASESSRAKENVNLFQIKGTSELNTRAVEVILDFPPPLNLPLWNKFMFKNRFLLDAS